MSDETNLGKIKFDLKALGIDNKQLSKEQENFNTSYNINWEANSNVFINFSDIIKLDKEQMYKELDNKMGRCIFAEFDGQYLFAVQDIDNNKTYILDSKF